MPLRDDLLNPISADNPSGKSLRYDPLYDKIKEARRADDDAPQCEWAHERKVADWKQVVKLTSEALATKSKDLQIAAWLTEAALRVESFAGLLSGLKILQGLVENFWDTLYPELEDGDAEMRAGPLDWVGSRFDQAVHEAPITRSGLNWFQFKQSRQLGYEADVADSTEKAEARAQAIAEGKVTAEDFDSAFNASPKAFYVDCKQSLDDCLEAIDALDAACEPKFGGVKPGFGGLRSCLEEVRATVNGLLQKKRELEPDEEPSQFETTAGEAPAEETPAEGGAPARPKKTLSAEPADKDDAVSRVAMVAKYLRREDPYSPAPYLMLRGLRWGELRSGSDSPSLELLAPPATQVRQELKRLAVEGNWAELIEAAENAVAMPCGRAWLDVQRYAVKALDEFGYPAIAAAIRSEMRSLLADLPQLPQWTLADDTPVANPETQAWLKEVTAQPQSVDPFGAAPAMESAKVETNGSGNEPAAPPDAFQVAMNAARSGDVQLAVEVLSREIAHERSGRARFQRKIQLAQICMSTGHEAIAYPILNEMADEIEQRKLEEWEASEILAHPLALLYRCMNQLDGDADTKRKLYARICRLDPVQALACTK